MDKRYVAAIELLRSFKQNDTVRATLEGGKEHDMYVSRTIHLSDYAFGSPESSRVTVTYGPGRYSCDITADMLVLGTAEIEARKVSPAFYMKDDGVGRTYFTWDSLVKETVATMNEYATSLRMSADLHDDRNHNLAEQVEDARDELLEIADPGAVDMPIEITIGILDLEIGKK